ncbi:hypothetical protein ACRAWD_00875 [Caulobacter segnis]
MLNVGHSRTTTASTGRSLDLAARRQDPQQFRDARGRASRHAADRLPGEG